jgi:ribosome-binding ATPase YchF (GTP1/OBG family)
MLADLESSRSGWQNIVRKVRGGDKEAVQQERLKEAQAALEEGRPARTVEVSEEDAKAWKMLQLLTTKPILYVCNVAEESAATGNAHSAKVAEMAEAQGAAHVVISAQIEEEIAQLDAGEAAEFLAEMGLEEAGLDRLIRAGYALLDLETYFTVGPKEARAWTIRRAPWPRRRPGSSTAISNAASSGPRPSPMSDFISLGGEAGREGGRQDAGRGQGIRGQGRRRPALPVQRLRPLRPPRPSPPLAPG